MLSLTNIWHLGIKELWSLRRDPIMLTLMVFTFTASVYSAATAQPDTLHLAPIAIVDEDGSPLSARLISAFFPPQFLRPDLIDMADADQGLDAGRYTFSLDIPPHFQRDLLAGRNAEIQLNVDATRMSQALTGSAYVEQIVRREIGAFMREQGERSIPEIALATRMRFNPNLDHAWFGAPMEIINNVTMLSIILTGAALIREREHGTVEHLLAMPVTPAQIMVSKIWSMGLVVLLATLFSLTFIVRGALGVPMIGSTLLFLSGTALHLFATTSLGIFLATLALSMPRFGMLVVLVLLPMEMLSGGMTPRESMPSLVQDIMLVSPTTHFVELGQSVLLRGAGLAVVWKNMAALAAIGSVLFALSLYRFRKTIGQLA